MPEWWEEGMWGGNAKPQSSTNGKSIVTSRRSKTKGATLSNGSPVPTEISCYKVSIVVSREEEMTVGRAAGMITSLRNYLII